MLDFVLMALPFVIIGICLIVIIVNNKKNKIDSTYIGEGMCLGICFGVLFGSMFSNHLGMFLSLGLLVGEAIGSCINKKGK